MTRRTAGSSGDPKVSYSSSIPEGSVELGASDGAALEQAFELLELRRDVAPAHPAAGEPSRLVDFHLRMDQVLYSLRAAHVGEPLLTRLSTRLDQEIARPEHSLEDPLVEEHVVDALQRDLDAALGQHATSEDDPVARDHEVGVGPLGVRTGQPDGGTDDRPDRDVGQEPRGVAVEEHAHEDADDDRRDQRHHGFGEEPPVGVQVEGHRFVIVQQLLRVRHDENSTVAPWTPAPC